MKILIIEDEYSLADAIAETLKKKTLLSSKNKIIDEFLLKIFRSSIKTSFLYSVSVFERDYYSTNQ